MKRAAKIAVLAMLVVVALSSCTTFQLSGLQVTKTIPSYTAVGEFDIEVKVWEFAGTSGGSNILNITADAMDTAIYDAIQREISKFTGDAAVNVEIKYVVTPMDALINGFSGTLLAPATAKVTGIIVKYN